MYERVIPKPPRKKQKSALLWTCLVLAVLLLISVLTPIIWGVWYRQQFYDFVSELSYSTDHAYRHNSFSVTWAGEPRPATADLAYGPYRLLGSMGPGSPASPPEDEPDVLLTYGDGASLSFWATQRRRDSGDLAREEGLLIHYVGRSGDSFTYDLDGATLNGLEFLLTPKMKRDALRN